MSKKQLSYFLWTEKYRPDSIDGVILPNDIKLFFKKIVDTKDLPNILLSSVNPGSGKTTVSRALVNDLDADHLFINISKDGGIDTLRSTIQKFASNKSLSGKQKVVIMDECLEENEEILFGTLSNINNIKLKDIKFNKMYDIVSFNLKTQELENDTCELISEKDEEVFEIELENGEKILVTDNHPFIIKENNNLIQKSIKDGLNENDYLLLLDN